MKIHRILELEDTPLGVQIINTLKVGFGGLGALLDPLLRLHLSQTFANELDLHVRTEFSKLRDMLYPST